MNMLFIVSLLTQWPPLVPAEPPDRQPAVPRGPFVPLEAPAQAETTREAPRRRLWELFVPASLVGFGGWVAAMAEIYRCGISIFSQCETPSVVLMVPVGGPFLAIARDGPSDRWFGHNLAFGLVQFGAVAAMLAGLAVSVPVGGDEAVSIAPTGDGVALGGTF